MTRRNSAKNQNISVGMLFFFSTLLLALSNFTFAGTVVSQPTKIDEVFAYSEFGGLF